MPINPRKFERLITNHFATVTKEAFLENLRKCSPYLFTDNSEETNDTQISHISDLNSNNSHPILDRQTQEQNKLDRYREIVKSLISNYANSDISNDEVEVQLILDVERDHYQWMNVGWQGSNRIYRCMMHFDIKDGKIWIQQNLTDRDPAEELVNMGVEIDLISDLDLCRSLSLHYPNNPSINRCKLCLENVSVKLRLYVPIDINDQKPLTLDRDLGKHGSPKVFTFHFKALLDELLQGYLFNLRL